MVLGSFDFLNFNTSLLAVVPLELLIILHFIDRKIDQLIAKIIARLIRNKNKDSCFTTRFIHIHIIMLFYIFVDFILN